VPIDLAVGWGPMSDQQVLDHLHVSQSMRFFWYDTKCRLHRGRNKLSISDQHSHHSVDARVGGAAAKSLAFWGASFILVANWSRQPVRRSNVAQFIEPYRFG